MLPRVWLKGLESIFVFLKSVAGREEVRLVVELPPVASQLASGDFISS
jgi:hypothetical protein